MSGTYMIRSLKHPNRCYIGSSKDIKHRWDCHLSDLRGNKHHSNKLQNHYNKYGENDLIFTILTTCEIDKDIIIANEQFFIDSYKPWFNIREKAESNLGVKYPMETKLKMSIAAKGRVMSDEQKEKIRQSMLGKNQGPRPDSVKEKLRKFHTGRKNSQESNERNRLSHLGRIPWNKGKSLSAAHKLKIKESCNGINIGIKRTPEQRHKLSLLKKGVAPWNKGKTGIYSEETKQKMSDSLKKYNAERKIKLAS